MTTLEKIVKKAQALKKSYPNKFAKWTDYVKEASKEFRSTTTPAKKKSKLAGVKKKAPKKVVSKKLTSKKASDLIRAEVKSKKFIMPHGYEVRKSKLAGNNNDKFIIDQINYIISLKTISQKKDTIKNSLLPNLNDYNLDQMTKKITKDNLDYALKQKSVSSINNVLKTSINALKTEISGSKITPAEHYLSYAPPSKPSEQQIYKKIERVKQDILRLQAMQKDHMFKKHKASLNGAINTKNREIKELLNKLK